MLVVLPIYCLAHRAEEDPVRLRQLQQAKRRGSASMVCHYGGRNCTHRVWA
jgi:hypothetical protein